MKTRFHISILYIQLFAGVFLTYILSTRFFNSALTGGHQISYTVGLENTLIFASAGSICLMLILLWRQITFYSECSRSPLAFPSYQIFSTHKSVRWRVSCGILIRSILTACMSWLLVSTLVYPLLNAAFQLDAITLDTMHKELSEGILQLRIASLTTGVAAGGFFINRIKHADQHYGGHVGQYAFYFIVIASIWHTKIVHTPYPVGAAFLPIAIIVKTKAILLQIAGWLLFSIIGDWIIISEYTTNYTIAPVASHKLKITRSNIAFAILVPTLLVLSSTYRDVLYSIALIALCLFYPKIDAFAKKWERTHITMWENMTYPYCIRNPYHR